MRGRWAGLAALLLCIVLTVCASRSLDRQRLREALETAKEAAGCVVSQGGNVTAGQEAWLDFYETSQAGRPAAVRLMRRFGGDESGPEQLYVRDLCFDGERYILSGENIDGGPWEAEYRYLLYFPDVPAPSLSSLFESETSYVLTDDDTLTWAEIWDSWFSSRSEGRIRTYEVYTEYVWRETFVNDDLM